LFRWGGANVSMAETTLLPNPLREGIRLAKLPQPCAMVIFGASGDLTQRKLIPALYNLARERRLPAGFSVVGCSKTPYTHEQFRHKMREALEKSSAPVADDALLKSFCQGIFYLADDFSDPKAYIGLARLLDELDRERGAAGNRLFYLATPPSFFTTIIQHLGTAALARPQQPGKTWTRLIIEKPFGRDLESARELNRVLGGVFEEDQVHRIDHYLGKETVQNLLVFRFANGIFEPIWNRRYIDHVQITVAEELGIGKRGGYYEEAGLVRDMIQNHVMQLLSLAAMEPPATFEAREVHDEKAKVLRAVRPLTLEQIESFAVRGQYTAGWVAGQKVPGYRSEPGVSPASTTETYAALKLYIDNWRWADVPFYLRSGKRLPKPVSEITIQFRRAPHLLFRDAVGDSIRPNLLSLRIQPNEGIALEFSAKLPATTFEIRPVRMDFRYAESFGAETPTAYETLLLDCMLGDQTLFNREDAVELAWELLTPLLARWQADAAQGLAFYEAGSWGPLEADALIGRDGRQWKRL
jgi:glucose-6-phosphate 1-dehydrogenase